MMIFLRFLKKIIQIILMNTFQKFGISFFFFIFFLKKKFYLFYWLINWKKAVIEIIERFDKENCGKITFEDFVKEMVTRNENCKK